MRLVDHILLALTRNIIVSQGGESMYQHIIKKQRKLLRHGILLVGPDKARPRQGQLLDQKKLTNAKYKYAVRYICKHEQVMRADLMAENLLCNNMNAFWKDVRSIHRSNVTLPCSIEGVSGAENIAELWRQHYTTLFNCVKSEPGKVEVVSSMDTGSITTN